MKIQIAGFQNAPDIAHIGNAGLPCCPDAGRKAETCPRSPNQQSHLPKDEWDCVWTAAYRLLPETSVRMMKALQRHLDELAQSGVRMQCVMNDSKDTGACTSPLNKRHKKKSLRSRRLFMSWLDFLI